MSGSELIAWSGDTTEYSVDELIQLWTQGDLGLDDTDQIVDTGPETVELKFEGSDGNLTLTYSLSADLTYRSDTEGGSPFNILEE